MEREVEAYLRRKHPAAISAVEVVEKEDLDLKNHLSGLKRRLMKARPAPATEAPVTPSRRQHAWLDDHIVADCLHNKIFAQ